MKIYTFLFTDIQGSTRLWETQPQEMLNALERHNQILQAAVTARDGRIFRTVGDAYCAVFNSASAALETSVTSQRRLQAEDWSLDSPLRVRMGLHTGEAESRGGDFVGASLNLLGRLMAVCHGGQILMTNATQALVSRSLPPGVTLLDLGHHQFRDMAQHERIFQVQAPGLPAEFPPLPTQEIDPNNLPSPATSFIGRQHELNQALSLLAGSRLLTLTGPGGTGKSRLSLQVAKQSLNGTNPDLGFPDGVWLVELAPIADPDLVLPLIAALFNLRELPARPLRELLTDVLRSKKLLLILDNCEHLIETCAQLTELLLRSCPQLKIMASSREPLGLSGEAILRVPPLSLPETTPQVSPEELQRYESVQLFTERAAAVLPGFSLTQVNAAAVAQICRRLDGIPLALELAAARIQVLSPQEIASRLDNRFRLLTGGSRTALPRQQTLQALIDWSYELLTQPEKALLARLSVFAGGWTFPAAEALGGTDVLDLLPDLVNKSLVLVAEDQSPSQRRFRFLETIRQYASDRLFESGEAENARNQHLDYFADFARFGNQKLMGPEQRGWLARLEREHDNLRVALEWALEHAPVTALQLCGDLSLFWSRRGYAAEGHRWAQSALQAIDQQPPSDPATNQTIQAVRVYTLNGRGALEIAIGLYPAAVETYAESIAISRELETSTDLAFALGMQGLVLQLAGSYPQARNCAEETLALSHQLNYEFGIQLANTVIGMQNTTLGEDFEGTYQLVVDTITMLQASGNEWFAATAMFGLGSFLMHARGDFIEAQAQIQKSHQIFQEMGDRQFTNITRSALAELDHRIGNYSQAIRSYQETLEEWRLLGNRGAAARVLECLAFVCRHLAQQNTPQQDKYLQQAGVLYGAASAIRQANGSPMAADEVQEYEAELQAFKALAGPQGFEQAWDEGQAMSLEQAVDFALTL